MSSLHAKLSLGEAALARRAREAGLHRLDDARSPVRDQEQRIAEAAPAHVLECGGTVARGMVCPIICVSCAMGCLLAGAGGDRLRLMNLFVMPVARNPGYATIGLQQEMDEARWETGDDGHS